MNAIISCGFGSWYPRGVQRLKISIEGGKFDNIEYSPKNFDGDFIGRTELPSGWPSHEENKYAFKVFAMKDALEKYENVLWLDASFWAIKNPKPIFDIIEKEGYFLWDSGWKIGQWTNDKTLLYANMNRNKAMEAPMLSSGCIGINRHSFQGKVFMAYWAEFMRHGYFNGSHTREIDDKEDERYLGHRHDQSCASIAAFVTGMELQGNDLVNYDRGDTRETVCLVCRGMG